MQPVLSVFFSIYMKLISNTVGDTVLLSMVCRSNTNNSSFYFYLYAHTNFCNFHFQTQKQHLYAPINLIMKNLFAILLILFNNARLNYKLFTTGIHTMFLFKTNSQKQTPDRLEHRHNALFWSTHFNFPMVLSTGIV